MRIGNAVLAKTISTQQGNTVGFLVNTARSAIEVEVAERMVAAAAALRALRERQVPQPVALLDLDDDSADEVLTAPVGVVAEVIP